jgi:hypothetical protein
MTESQKPRIGLLTSAALPKLYLEESELVPAFNAAGADARAVVWSDPDVDWRGFALIVIRSPWDYFERPEEFRDWLKARAADGSRVLNPLPLVEWNIDKFYLRDLHDAGIATLPTRYVPRGGLCDLRDVATEHGWDELVVKPSVAGGAFRAVRFLASDCAGAQRVLDETLFSCGALVQRYAPEITTEGEWSIFYFAGVYSHAVLKVPAVGDFRVQPQFGSTITRMEPPPALLADAEKVLAACPVRPTYARIDGISREGRLILMEAELIEPYLFLGHAPEARDRYIAAVMGTLAE